MSKIRKMKTNLDSIWIAGELLANGESRVFSEKDAIKEIFSTLPEGAFSYAAMIGKSPEAPPPRGQTKN